ncbi:polysaccharide deacetylase family protein [Paenibacillus sp. NEAU-GSW1]|uniref:polysaccharide deacetylase family protein n=1 Tax=Paenibacillus sp. NEAU-GSW1 TaxID=2682486 RepID=UPI0012E2C16B|nr:polysaccharide deacetylase family protein [Paenibacillus sp. NEAU-GSW1]MUT64601.1 ChbG/HpnK family deacetylase [Paenibacillus sp. NEAU-GSW1]
MIQRLGFAADDRVLIINADDLGITKGTNEAIVDLFEQQAITSTSIMMPCADSDEAMEMCTKQGVEKIGIHITLTSGERHSYTPVFQKSNLNSLLTAEGYFHKDAALLETNADEKEVRIEIESQIQSAIARGIDPTHLDSHAGSIMGFCTGRDFLELTFDLCEKYRLPFNLPYRIVEQPFLNADQKKRFQARLDSAKERGILSIDDIVLLPYCFNPLNRYKEMKRQLIELIKNIKPGITQLTVHPAQITDALIEATGCYKEREIELQLLNDVDIKQWIQRERIKLMSWADIRDLQRSV